MEKEKRIMAKCLAKKVGTLHEGSPIIMELSRFTLYHGLNTATFAVLILSDPRGSLVDFFERNDEWNNKEELITNQILDEARGDQGAKELASRIMPMVDEWFEWKEQEEKEKLFASALWKINTFLSHQDEMAIKEVVYVGANVYLMQKEQGKPAPKKYKGPKLDNFPEYSPLSAIRSAFFLYLTQTGNEDFEDAIWEVFSSAQWLDKDQEEILNQAWTQAMQDFGSIDRFNIS